MLRVISEAAAFQKVPVEQLLPSKRYCAVCGSMVNGVGYVDNKGWIGKGEGVTLCENDAFAAMQSSSQPLPQEQRLQQQEQVPQGQGGQTTQESI